MFGIAKQPDGSGRSEEQRAKREERKEKSEREREKRFREDEMKTSTSRSGGRVERRTGRKRGLAVKTSGQAGVKRRRLPSECTLKSEPKERRHRTKMKMKDDAEDEAKISKSENEKP